MSAEDWFRKSFAECEETNEAFDEMANTIEAFFNMDDWNSVVRQNYYNNKALVDQQWQFGLDRWNQGVYFDAGMFYGRAWRILATGEL